MKRTGCAVFLAVVLAVLLGVSSTAVAGESAEDQIPDSAYVITIPLPPERYEELYGMPEETLSASTPELLEAFLSSAYMMETVYSPFVASTPDIVVWGTSDLSIHAGFLELMSRYDLIPALEGYAAYILSDAEVLNELVLSFRLLLGSEEFRHLVDARLYNMSNYPILPENALDRIPVLTKQKAGYWEDGRTRVFFPLISRNSALMNEKIAALWWAPGSMPSQISPRCWKTP